MISIPHRLKIASLPMTEALYQHAAELRVACTGIVVSFDPGPQWGYPSISVQPTIREQMVRDAAPISEALPILDAVPVCVPQGGDWIDTFPITAGDECLLVFADTCLDLWKQNGGVQNQPDGFNFRHDIGDAIAIFGVSSAARPISNWSTTSRQIRNREGTVVIDLEGESVTVTAPAVSINATGGMPRPLMNDGFVDWYIANIQPFLVAKGYTGPTLPPGYLTTVLGAE